MHRHKNLKVNINKLQIVSWQYTEKMTHKNREENRLSLSPIDFVDFAIFAINYQPNSITDPKFWTKFE